MTSKLTITRERLEEIRDYDTCVTLEESAELARMVLAAMDSEPVAWTDEQELRDVECGGCGYLFTVNPVTPHADERRIILLYRHAQPAPVVPEDIPDCVYEILCQACGGNAWMYSDALWNACRAAMLHAGNSPAQNHFSPEQNGDTPAQRQGWIPVSERLPDEGDHVLVSDGVGMEVSWIRGREWKKLRHVYSEDVTHWMPLPAAPQEGK
ncbi:DUF551 domain-containing protein [Klebsiella quasipneumoniae subsp. quasipneumoniae]|uniref:DUF551 domain-containing protein n=1 Tax=Klebsiella quasipneumoniae TaxID=1463165 RepID=UPI0022F128DF|nr:DUF551 domain-containing protein [Klebsiella quasipneumoniae]MDA5091456.1 DUF551 domain-containing protein [Klebsiella quasipneumoniae subsp. quasipneumoniae]